MWTFRSEQHGVSSRATSALRDTSKELGGLAIAYVIGLCRLGQLTGLLVDRKGGRLDVHGGHLRSAVTRQNRLATCRLMHKTVAGAV